MSKQEIEALKIMIRNWKESYIKLANEEVGEDNAYLLEDFIDEIQLYFPNYMRRLLDIDYIDEKELTDFIIFIREETNDLKRILGV